ncbi:MAG: hypothetical protein NTW96_22505 [Planctomycetia bacterium]|nr:hypothetical protein [Planctomycetia bacterium]
MPRKVARVEAVFAQDVPAAAKESIRVEYWHGSWDGGPELNLADAASARGWVPIDDWTNGQWKRADAEVQADGRRLTFVLKPTGKGEFPDLAQPGVPYRKTLKVRISSDGALPKIEAFQVFTTSTCRPITVRIVSGTPGNPAVKLEGEDACHLEVFNGKLLAARPLPKSPTKISADGQWTVPANGEAGVEADLLVTDDPADRSIVTVRSRQRPFSFATDDLAKDRILVDDLGVLVARADDPVTLQQARQDRKTFGGRGVYDRVFDMPEQTLSRAWDDMPLKHPLWFVHGLPGNRNAVKQYADGEVWITSIGRWFNIDRSPRDSERKGWPGDGLTLRFGFPPESCRAGRELYKGYLPVLRTWWIEGPLYYEQQTLLDKLDADMSQSRLDDPTVLVMKVRVVNVSTAETATARLALTSPTDDKGLDLDGDQVVARTADGPRLRYLLKPGKGGELKSSDGAISWSRELKPGQSHELNFAIPTITLTGKDEIEQLRKRDFDEARGRVCQFWDNLTAASAEIQTPEPWLNHFYKAHLRHLEVNCVKDLNKNWRYARVGTFGYGLFPNESIMMVADLERRGCHKAAEDCLDSWIHYQGSVGLPGNFKSADGVFYGTAGYEHVGYNKHHGYVMWGMAEHWRMTRDRKWMERVAPNLIKACDWVTRERQATMQPSEDGSRPIEYGFLPAGGLEDVQDYWYWTATNAATVWGFDAVADALADFGHPDAPRLVKDARAYHDDVMRGITESRILSPVVRLRDGTYVPKFPSCPNHPGRSVGWIRETLEGPMFLLTYQLIAPETPEATWIIKDYEDNLYISDVYGYAIPNFDEFWFSRGGFSFQANLLEGPVPYLYRDEIKHFVRAYFNGFASAFYPGTMMLNEHSKPELGYPAGDHFKSSDEANVTGWLRMMFIREDGKTLYLGQGIPRYWMAAGQPLRIARAATHFGPMSLEINLEDGGRRIKAVLTPPGRNPPEKIYLRLRHPEGKPIERVTVNGKPYEKFDREKEWVELPGKLDGVQEIVAEYGEGKGS